MRELDFKNKTVLDFGTGTGILAILAEKLGASKITALDNDEWSIRNAKENFLKNNCREIEILQTSTVPSGGHYGIILANINRNVIMENFHLLESNLNGKGHLLLSGLLKTDEEVILERAGELGLELHNLTTRGEWIALRLVRLH
jgi:ribosomal protein L11 methyltransferase